MKKLAALVDDDQEDLDLLTDCIHQIDDSIRCISFADPEAAMNFFASGGSPVPTHIFLDVNMPKTNGVELLLELRRIRRFDLSVVAMFSTSMPSERAAEYIRQGADFALAKPTDYKKYVEDLRNIFVAVRLPARR